jgi:hypothetical protein
MQEVHSKTLLYLVGWLLIIGTVLAATESNKLSDRAERAKGTEDVPFGGANNNLNNNINNANNFNANNNLNNNIINNAPNNFNIPIKPVDNSSIPSSEKENNPLNSVNQKPTQQQSKAVEPPTSPSVVSAEGVPEPNSSNNVTSNQASRVTAKNQASDIGMDLALAAGIASGCFFVAAIGIFVFRRFGISVMCSTALD